MYKKRNKVKKAISFFLIIMLLVQVQEMPVSAGANKKIVKMLHGKWETDGMRGIANYDQWSIGMIGREKDFIVEAEACIERLKSSVK